jgi:hypothetical protein
MNGACSLGTNCIPRRRRRHRPGLLLLVKSSDGLRFRAELLLNYSERDDVESSVAENRLTIVTKCHKRPHSAYLRTAAHRVVVVDRSA